MTRETETLFYNIRMIIDTHVESEPRAWLISKVNRISPNGVCRITLAQDIFNQHSDYIEKDADGNIIGMWADYYKSNIEPSAVPVDDAPPSSITAKITCTGKSQFKIGGSAKTFTVRYFNEDNVETDYTPGIWSLSINDEVISNDLVELTELDDNKKLKVKFLGDDSYIGKILTITNKSDDVEASIQVEIIAL